MRRKRDPCYKKASFEVLETFVCFLLLRSCATIKDGFFNTRHSLLLLLPPSLSGFFFPLLPLVHRRMQHGVGAERPYISCSRFEVLMTTWRANHSQRFLLDLPLSLLRFQQSHLAFLTSLRPLLESRWETLTFGATFIKKVRKSFHSPERWSRHVFASHEPKTFYLGLICSVIFCLAFKTKLLPPCHVSAPVSLIKCSIS